jgi:hypothetical protein
MRGSAPPSAWNACFKKQKIAAFGSSCRRNAFQLQELPKAAMFDLRRLGHWAKRTLTQKQQNQPERPDRHQ